MRSALDQKVKADKNAVESISQQQIAEVQREIAEKI